MNNASDHPSVDGASGGASPSNLTTAATASHADTEVVPALKLTPPKKPTGAAAPKKAVKPAKRSDRNVKSTSADSKKPEKTPTPADEIARRISSELAKATPDATAIRREALKTGMDELMMQAVGKKLRVSWLTVMNLKNDDNASAILQIRLKVAPKQAAEGLAKIGREVTRLDKEICKTEIEATAKALSAGKWLAVAKAALGHGGYGKWRKAHCNIADRTADRYKALWDRFSGLRDKSEQSRVKKLGLSEAYSAVGMSLRAPSTNPQDPVDPPESLELSRAMAAASLTLFQGIKAYNQEKGARTRINETLGLLRRELGIPEDIPRDAMMLTAASAKEAAEAARAFRDAVTEHGIPKGLGVIVIALPVKLAEPTMVGADAQAQTPPQSDASAGEK